MPFPFEVQGLGWGLRPVSLCGKLPEPELLLSSVSSLDTSDKGENWV